MQSKEPTRRQRRLLQVIWELWQEKGYGPSFREIAAMYGVTSLNGLEEGLVRLQRKGWIDRDNMIARTVRLTPSGKAVAGINPQGQ